MRRPELDGIRGLAILLVMLCHAAIAPFGYTGGVLGVTMFFVLSGYLITSILQAELDRTGRLRIRAFYARRFWRLMPALAVMALACAIVRGLEGRPDLLGLLAALFYFSDYVQAFHVPVMLEHTWSLGVEEQFYLLWPLALLGLFRLRHRARPWVIVLAVAVLGWTWREVVFRGGDYVYAYRAFDTNAFALLAGCSLALSRRRLSQWAGTAGAVGIGWLAISPFNGWSAWVPGLGAVFTVLLIGGAAGHRRLTVAPLTWTGRVSYSLYLWHAVIFPGLAIQSRGPVGKGGVILVASVVSVASYYLIERPFLAWRDQRASSATRAEGLVKQFRRVEPAAGAAR